MTTTEEQWLPLGVDGDDAVQFTAPWTEIPDYFQQSLWEWIEVNIIGRGYGGEAVLRADLVREAERKLHVELPPLEAHHTQSGPNTLRKHYKKLGIAPLLRFVDFLMSSLPANHRYLQALEERLVESGSGWRVGTRAGKPGLVQRLPQGVVDAAAATVLHGAAGRRLAEAWEAAFGINPDPSNAYRLAVKAVEAACAPVVIPNDPNPTLGKAISRIEQGGQFRLPHLREDPRALTHNILLGLMRMLWVGQHDRHDGQPASSLPSAVTQDEAESAVILAVTLVGWFETGKVQQ